MCVCTGDVGVLLCVESQFVLCGQVDEGLHGGEVGDVSVADLTEQRLQVPKHTHTQKYFLRAGYIFQSYSKPRRTRANVPVCVQTGDGGFPVAVQVLRLLQEDVVEDSGDVDGDVVLYGLKHRHVGPHAGQQLTGLGYLLSSLVVHGHPHYGPTDRRRDGRIYSSSTHLQTSAQIICF